jgi:hypothetical protein
LGGCIGGGSIHTAENLQWKLLKEEKGITKPKNATKILSTKSIHS